MPLPPFFSLKGVICTSVQSWAILKLPLLALVLLSYSGLANPTFLQADAPTVTVLTSSLNPSFTGNNVTITATVTSGGNPVTPGSVSFFEGVQALATNVPLNGSGQATFSKSDWTEGSHSVTANYNGVTGFAVSSGTLTQTVYTATTVNGTTFCNEGGITINDNGEATPYPSRIIVSGLTGTIEKITITLKNLTHTAPDDIDLLLYSPTGQKFVFMSDAGGTNAVTDLDLIFDSSAASPLPDNTTLVSGTFRPADFEVSADAFPAPAPAGPYTSASTTGLGTLFVNTNPIGAWYLYAVDDAATNTGSIGGWCLNFTMSCTSPNINAPTVTQPTCAVPTGTIVVNAAGSGTLEYSINNGTDWQTNATFSGLTPGNYNIKVRLQDTPSCEVSYGSNPVVLNSPFTASTTTDTWTGCVSTNWNTAGNWQDGSVPTAADDVVIPSAPTNQPTLSTTATAKSVEVRTGASLSITNSGSLTINGSKTVSGFAIAFYNSGTVVSEGQVILGNTASVGLMGIWNNGSFTNNGGAIIIDRVTNQGINNGSTFTNTGAITIGASVSGGIHGIWNQNRFDNTGGSITIDRTTTQGVYNTNTFNNSGLITIGATAITGGQGVNNSSSGIFNNKMGGLLTINRSTGFALENFGTLDNIGTIRIGNITSVADRGIVHRNGGTLNNKLGGLIQIDRTSAVEAFFTSGVVNNEATIEIGSNAAVTGIGVSIVASTGTFNNKTDGLLTINGSTIWGMENKGTLDNSGTIRVGNIASVGAICIVHRSGGTFNNKTGGAIYMDRTTAGGQALYSSGLVNNEGSIKIGSNATVAGEGIRIEGDAFNNKTGGNIQIDQTGSYGIRLLNSGTVFNNEALIEIGSQSDVKGDGIRNGNGCTFNNKVGGDIYINRIGISGNTILCIINFGTFNNDAKITIGNIGLVFAQDGIYNAGSFTNNAAGIISIAKPWGNGVWNTSGTFQNAGKITISNVVQVSGNFSTGILSTAPFTNSAGAQIYLDQVANGIATTNAFTNAGLIRMGENGLLTGSGIANIQGVNAVFNNNAGGDISIKQTAVDGMQNDALSTFNNNACAKLVIFDNLKNAGTFTNAGLFTVNTAQVHTNTALTNNGVIEYPQGNPIPNVTNNALIANSVSGCVATVTSALQIGGMNSFTVATAWFKDQALTQPAGTYDQNTNTFTANGLVVGNTHQLYFSITDPVNMCARTVSIPVTLNSLSTATILNTNSPICTGGNAAFTISGTNGATLTYTITGLAGNQTLLLDGSNQTITANNATTDISLTLVSVTKNDCPAMLSATATVRINAKPTITLSVNGQTFNEGNSTTLCDTDANPENPLQFTVTGACISGLPVWRTQIGAGNWSEWSSTAPTTQLSNNTVHRYQAACDGACPSTYTTPMEVTINYRASTPQNVSLVADGTTINAGESKTICNLEGNTLTFNATCAAGEILLYSIDGGDYSPAVPSQIVDGNFHNYRVRCRKADNTPSCVETESATMSLKITTSGPAPTVSITPTDGCGTPTAFSGSSTCGALTTIWYNAATNQALPTLPTSTPNVTTSFYARCQNEAGCLSENSNTVTFTITPVNDPPTVSASAEIVCTGTQVTISANCPNGSTAFWNTGVTTNSFQVAFSNVTKQSYWAKCIFPNGCQSPESTHKTILWKAFELTFINIGQSQSATKPANGRNLWSSQFITKDAGPVLENSTEANPTIYYSENVNKTAPRFWTIQTEICALGTDGSVTYDMLATPEVGEVRSYNTHENNAPYLMYANREGFTELYAQNHPAYGFYQDNGSGGNVYDTGLPKGLYKLGIRYWDQKGQGSIYPSTRQPAGNVLAYQEYWFRIQSQNGIGTGSARVAATTENGLRTTDNGAFAQVMPNPVANIMHLKINEVKGQKVNVSMIDASGRTLVQRAFVPQTHQHQEEFEVSQLSNGMYFLRVNTAEKQATLKVVKME